MNFWSDKKSILGIVYETLESHRNDNKNKTWEDCYKQVRWYGLPTTPYQFKSWISKWTYDKEVQDTLEAFEAFNLIHDRHGDDWYKKNHDNHYEP